MKNTLIIAENRELVKEIVNKLSNNNKGIISISSSNNEAFIVCSDFRVKIVVKGSSTDEFTYDEVYELTHEKLLNAHLLNVSKEIFKEISTKEPTQTIGEFISNIEQANPVEIKKEFDIKSIPLQLLTKVNKDTSNKEIESILSTIKSIEYFGFFKESEEGKELSRIEKLLEDKIILYMNKSNYKTLEHSVHLLKKVKENYRIVVTSGNVGGSKLY